MLGEHQDQKEKILIGLKKADSHVRRIIEMVENNDYCIDVIQQLLAVQGLLRSAQSQTLESHLKTCFKRGMEGKNKAKKEKLVAEILQLTKFGNK